MEKSNRFQIIEGGAKAPSDWLDFPKVVIGRAVDDPHRVVAYRIATEDARAAASTGRRQKAFELWSAVIGVPPPVPNIARHLPLGGLTSFAKAHACFQGLKRPVADDKHGFDSFAFIIEPGIIFTTTADMVCCAEPMMVPRDLLLAVYVRLDYPHGRPNGFNGSEPASVGIVTHWEFLERSPDDTSLPIDHAERYRRRRW
jgi:hypothetical protein|tara:strand:- start:17584 stop:18183 length:600 start_codon:yes stop_codon:yes gene_type:complete